MAPEIRDRPYITDYHIWIGIMAYLPLSISIVYEYISSKNEFRYRPINKDTRFDKISSMSIASIDYVNRLLGIIAFIL